MSQMTFKDYFSLVAAGTVFVFAALFILASVSLPFAIALLLWKAVFA